MSFSQEIKQVRTEFFSILKNKLGGRQTWELQDAPVLAQFIGCQLASPLGRGAVRAFLLVTGEPAGNTAVGPRSEHLMRFWSNAIVGMLHQAYEDMCFVFHGRPSESPELQGLKVLPDELKAHFALYLFRSPTFYATLRRLVLAFSDRTRRTAWKVYLPGSPDLTNVSAENSWLYDKAHTVMIESIALIFDVLLRNSWAIRMRLADDVGLIDSLAASSLSTPTLLGTVFSGKACTSEQDILKLSQEIIGIGVLIPTLLYQNPTPWIEHLAGKRHVPEYKALDDLCFEALQRMTERSKANKANLELRVRNLDRDAQGRGPNWQYDVIFMSEVAFPCCALISTFLMSEEHGRKALNDFKDDQSAAAKECDAQKHIDMCDYCGLVVDNEIAGSIALKRCGKCRVARYCSSACQQGAWTWKMLKHKEECFDARASYM